MGDDNTNQEKRKPKWTTSYSKTTIREAEKGLGIWLDSLKRDVVSVEGMFVQRKSLPTVESGGGKIKKRIYDNIVEHLEIEGYPTEADPGFKEATSTTWPTSSPILFFRIPCAKRDATYSYGGNKGSSIGEAMKQCLLSVKDIRDNNKAGEVYDFVTTGET